MPWGCSNRSHPNTEPLRPTPTHLHTSAMRLQQQVVCAHLPLCLWATLHHAKQPSCTPAAVVVRAGPASFYALRLALGVAESGAFPAMWHVCGQVNLRDAVLCFQTPTLIQPQAPDVSPEDCLCTLQCVLYTSQASSMHMHPIASSMTPAAHTTRCLCNTAAVLPCQLHHSVLLSHRGIHCNQPNHCSTCRSRTAAAVRGVGPSRCGKAVLAAPAGLGVPLST